MDALEAIAARRSIRSFKPDPVSEEALRKIVDAGRLAPTANNVQPWEFVIITDAERRRQIAELTENGKFISKTPVCIAVLSQPIKYYIEDGCAAIENMLIAAVALGLGTCWVAGDKKTYAAELASLCGAPPDLKLVAMIALGHPRGNPSPPKRSLDEVLHWESFGS